MSYRFQTTIWAGKLLLLFAGTISTLTLLKAAVIPFVVDLALSTVPQIWLSFRSSVMSPLYIYLVVNFIIFAIAATSTFQPRNDNASPSNDNKKKPGHLIQSKQKKTQSSTNINSSTLFEEEKTASNFATELLFTGDLLPEKNSGEDSGSYPTTMFDQREKEEEKMVNNIATEISFAGHLSPDTNSSDFSGENSMKIEEEEEGSSLEATWNAIMAARKLKKSESWNLAPRLVRADDHDHGDDQVKMEGQDDPAIWARREMRKLNTFTDRVSLRRDKSMSPEELNQRAEAFIKMVNNDIRLQRLESDQRFLDMVNRGL